MFDVCDYWDYMEHLEEAERRLRRRKAVEEEDAGDGETPLKGGSDEYKTD